MTAQHITCDDLEPAAFRKVLGHFATGVAIVTTPGLEDHGWPVGVTVNSFSAVSLDPPLVLFSAARTLRSLPALLAARHFGISLLSDNQRDIAARFATAGAAKWGQTVTRAATVPACALIAEALAHFECTPYAIHDGGDHLVFLLRVTRCGANTQVPPLLFFRGAYCQLHTEQRVAP